MDVPGEAESRAAGTVGAIAIVGAALRFPGAADPASFHELTVTGRRMFREFAGIGEDGGRPGGDRSGDLTVAGSALRAALLGEDVFSPPPGADTAVTGITGRHWLAAETAAAALADVPSGDTGRVSGRVGVFIADTASPGAPDVGDWVRGRLGLGLAGGDAHEAATLVGVIGLGGGADVSHRGTTVNGNGTGANGSGSAASGTGANGKGSAGNGTMTNGSGANRVVPGGLNCSLRAIAAACDALSRGSCDLALAGGVAIGIDPGWLRRSAAAGSLATHDVRVYDAYPTGTLPGEGCGVVVLMRAADARAAGLPGYAEIAGWHAAERGTAHLAALRPAYVRAGIDPADIQLVEGHGAATAAADLAELSVLSEVLGPHPGGGRDRCALGAVSANIGDTRGAAGIAALLKAALAMTAEVIPPATGCVRPNRLLRVAAAPFRLPPAAEPWPPLPVQLAAVNSLGVAPHPDAPRSGPVHVVLRRERDHTHRPGRRRRAVILPVGQPPTAGAAELLLGSQSHGQSPSNRAADGVTAILSRVTAREFEQPAHETRGP